MSVHERAHTPWDFRFYADMLLRVSLRTSSRVAQHLDALTQLLPPTLVHMLLQSSDYGSCGDRSAETPDVLGMWARSHGGSRSSAEVFVPEKFRWCIFLFCLAYLFGLARRRNGDYTMPCRYLMSCATIMTLLSMPAICDRSFLSIRHEVG